MFLSCFYLNFITLRTDLTLKIKNWDFHFLPRWNNRDRIYFPAWNSFLNGQNVWNNSIEDIDHLAVKHSEHWETGNERGEPCDCPASCLERVSRLQCRQGKNKQNWGGGSDTPGRPRKLEFAGQCWMGDSCREKSPEICRSYLSSTIQLNIDKHTCVRKLPNIPI